MLRKEEGSKRNVYQDYLSNKFIKDLFIKAILISL